MWYIHIWLTLALAMWVIVASTLETDIVSMRPSHLDSDGIRILRQISPALTTPIGYSSAAAPAPTPARPSIASNPIIIIPFLPSSTPPSSTVLSTSTLLSLSSSHNTSIPTYSLSSSASPTPTAQNTTARSPFKFIYLVPAVAIVGILLGGFIGWVLYRCLTRKPRVHRNDRSLLIGPRYVGIEPERHHIQGHNMERRGEPTPMKNLPGAIRTTPHFRWPSFDEKTEKPGFDPVQGFHVPDEYLHEDPFSAFPLANYPSTNVNTRTKSTRTTYTSKSLRTSKSTRSTAAGPSRDALTSPTSDTTSLALLELYESDEEGETRRKIEEVPWESLRHKSIKRGILEQVKKEGKWMDSIRGQAGSTLLGSRPEAITEEGNVLLGGPDESTEVENYVGRGRGYSVPESDPFADSPTRTYSISPKKRPAPSSRRTDSTIGFQIIPESAATTPNHSPRRGFTWLKKDGASNALEKLSRIPTPISEGRKRNQSQSRSQSNRSTSPIKRTSTNDPHVSQVPRRDIFPRSPAQIMNPPLHSQMCFTPVLASTSSARVDPQNSSEYHLKSRVSVSLSPTKPLMVSSASKGKKKVQAPHNLHHPPKPLASQHDQPQGRASDSAPTKQAVGSKGSRNIIAAESRTDMIEDPIKKVERIMASSWSARDLGQAGIRSLSPTEFGRRL